SSRGSKGRLRKIRNRTAGRGPGRRPQPSPRIVHPRPRKRGAPENRSPFMRRSLLGWWLLAGVAALGLCWFLFVLAPRRDSINGDENTHRRRPPWLDINKVGGTILVYEVDQPEPLTADKSDALPQAIENRVDPDGDLSVTV